ncbi:serine/threonine protein kinase, partial [Streptomyces sp. NPDC004726]
PTQVLPTNAPAFDPNGATSVLPHTGGPGGAADPTAVLPPTPPRPDGPPGGPRPEDPHPWQSQLRAARDRNEQTQVQYLDPSQDPLRRRPQRQPQQPPQQPQQQRYAQPQRPQPQPQPRQPQRRQFAPQPPQQPQPQPYAPQPPQPQQPQPPAPRQPRPPRQRSANPMRIPGLGCLKGCLVSVLMLVVAGWLIWELTPLQDWVAQGKGYWSAIGDGISAVTDWVSELGGSDPTTTDPATNTGG